MNKFKKDDNVQIIQGKDKGKTGKILEVDSTKQRVLVEGINIVKKHRKATKEADGGIIEQPSYLHWSNIKLICPITNKPTKVGFKTVKGKKSRFAKASNELIKNSK